MSHQPVILITGASRGIGAATALLAAQRGYAVAVNYRHEHARAQGVVDQIVQAGGRALALQADVAQEDQVVQLFETVCEQLGVPVALVNNAGMLEPQARVQDMDAARWRRVLDTNVVGTFLCAREAVRRMSTRRGGHGGAIVNLSSRAARLGAAGEYVDYAAAKAAVETFTIGLAREVGPEGIRVNVVAPGLIETELHALGGEPARVLRLASSVPLQRGGHAGEVAHAVLWLLSDEASYTTGAVLDVGGGR
ncbi:MAG: SDR family oxidoreductase [Rhodoferax sp.]